MFISDNYAMTTWTYEKKSINEALYKIANAGFKFVEIFGNLIHLDPRLHPDISEIKHILKKLGLRVDSIHAPYTGLALGYPKIQLKKEWLTILGKTMEFASELEAKYVIVHVTSFSEEITDAMYAKCIEISLDYINDLAEMARKLGLELALENLPYYTAPQFTWSLKDLSKIFTNPNIGFCYDIGHSPVNGFNYKSEINSVGKRLIVTHVSNNDGKYDHHWLPDNGILDWLEIKKELDRSGYKNRYTLEIRGENNPDSIINRMKDLFKKNLL